MKRYCIFIGEGGHTVETVQAPDHEITNEWIREKLQLGDVCLGFLPFGTPALPMYAIHDDEFLLKKKTPIGTVTITGVVLCSNVLICRFDGENMTGFSIKDLGFVIPRLQLARGKILRPPTNNDISVTPIDNMDDLLDELNAGARANQKANEREWGDE